MPLSSIASLSTLQAQAVAFLRSRFSTRASGTANFLGKEAFAWAMALFGIQRTAEAIDRDSPPQQKSSQLGLETWATISGLVSNLGGYGRNGAVAAKGGLAPVTGTATTLVTDGQELTAPDGVTVIKLVGDVTIPATGSFAAVTLGSAGNLQAGTVLTWVTPPVGCDATVTLSSALESGEDQETLAHLFQRIADKWQKPPKGGANIDYKTWAEEVEGVDTAYVFPRRRGSGTVDIVVTAPGSGTSRIPTNDVIDAVQAVIDADRPGDVEDALVMGPQMPDAAELTIYASVFLTPNYEWDWDDTGGSWAVAGYSGGTPSVTLDNPIPASLKSAVDNGDQPLIQIVSTTGGSSVIPEQRRVLSYDGTHLILTLDSAFSVAPTSGDKVYAGSYAAPLIAKAMLDFVDSLGPSRISGLADIVDEWEYIASVWGIGDAAVQTKDTDNTTRLVSRLAQASGLLIGVGIGSPAAVDYSPPDTYTLPPEIARAAHVVAKQAA